MRTIIAGTRSISGERYIEHAVLTCPFGSQISVVLSGGARGVDAAGAEWAEARGIPVETFPADWATHGKAAGPIRNRQMADNADALIAIWDGESRGTRNMMEEAGKRGLRMHVVVFNPESSR